MHAPRLAILRYGFFFKMVLVSYRNENQHVRADWQIRKKSRFPCLCLINNQTQIAMEKEKEKPANATRPKRFSNEDGARLIHNLLNSPQAWGEFLYDPLVITILQCVISASPLRNRISPYDLGHSIYLYTLTEKSTWLSSEKKDPGGIYGYFSKTARSLLNNRRFVKNYLGWDLKMYMDPLPIVIPVYTDDEGESSAIKALRQVEEFEDIVNAVWEKSPTLGELLYRYYCKLDDIQDIARDFLRDNKVSAAGFDGKTITDDVLIAAKNNLQTRKLNLAREAFNQIADTRHFPFRLEGKVKKSILKTLHATQ